MIIAANSRQAYHVLECGLVLPTVAAIPGCSSTSSGSAGGTCSAGPHAHAHALLASLATELAAL